MSEPIFEAALTCPECGSVHIETMPLDACQYFYECKTCGTLLRPKPGDWLRLLFIQPHALSTAPTSEVLLGQARKLSQPETWGRSRCVFAREQEMHMAKNYDLTVIGSGTAAQVASHSVASAGFGKLP